MLRTCVLPKVNYAPFVDMCEDSQQDYDRIDNKILNYLKQMMNI